MFTKIQLIHRAFEEPNRKVIADFQVPTGKIEDMLEFVFEKSQNIDSSWVTTQVVGMIVNVDRARSTSVGDVMLVEDNSVKTGWTSWVVSPFGFKQVSSLSFKPI